VIRKPSCGSAPDADAQGPFAGALLKIQVEELDGTVTLRVHGEIDLATAPGLRAHLDGVVAANTTDLVVDIHEVRFIDCYGYGLLMAAAQQTRERGRTLRLIVGSAFDPLLRTLGPPPDVEVLDIRDLGDR
jgi:anti-sigma B factor antagonist